MDDLSSVNSTFPISLKLSLRSDFEINAKEVSESLSDFAINKQKCEYRQVRQAVVCVAHSKDSASLLRLSDFWILLEDENEPNINGTLNLNFTLN